MRLRGGRRRVHLLFADFVGVLLLPALDLCGLELRGGKAPFFAVFDAEIFFLGLVLDGNAMRLSGFPNADEAAQVLDAGGVVVGDAGTIDAGGMVRVAISPNTAIVNESQATHIEKRKAIYVRGAFPLVMSPATAQALGIKQLRYLGEYLDFAGGNSPVTVKKASAYAIENLPLASTSTDGNRLPWGDNMALVPIGLLALLALMATLVSLLLARTQAQRDMATMVAVGAPPRFLRRYGLTQAAVILLAGAPVGVVSGVALGWLHVGMEPQDRCGRSLAGNRADLGIAGGAGIRRSGNRTAGGVAGHKTTAQSHPSFPRLISDIRQPLPCHSGAIRQKVAHTLVWATLVAKAEV